MFFRTHIKRFLLLASFILAALDSSAQLEWAQQMGGAEADLGTCTSADLSGHIFTIGTFSGTSAFGAYNISSLGKGDIFVTRINASTGNVDWIRQVGGANEDNGSAILCDPFGNVYCAGRFSGVVAFGNFTLTSVGSADSFLAKLDPLTGAVVWVKRMGGTGIDGGLALASDAQGEIYSSGYFQGTATFGTFTLTPVGTNLNIFLTRTNGASGNVVWAQGFGSSGYSFGTAISCDSGGDIYMTGYYESQITFGTTTLTAIQYQDVFVSKHYASTGNVAWVVSSGGAGNDNGTGITAGSDGYIYTTGKFESTAAFGSTTLTSQGNADIFISKRDNITGNLIWVSRFGAAGYEQTNAITHDGAGHVFITGQFTGFVNFGSTILASAGNADIFIAKIATVSGNADWALSMGGVSVDSGYGITCGPNDALYCTGSFQLVAAMGTSTFTTKGATDIFILKINAGTVGLKENKTLENTIQIMPIPFQDELTLEINKNDSEPYNLVITDVSGQQVLHLYSEETKQKLNLEVLKNGIYFLTITTKQGEHITKKIIKN